MQFPKYLEELKTLIETKSRSWHNLLKSTHKNVYDDMMATIDDKFKNSSVSTKVYVYMNDVHELPKCQICGKVIEDTFCHAVHGFRHTCDNPACQKQYKKLRTEQANLEKYGVKNPFARKDIIKKSRQTKLERYGSETYNNVEQAKATSVERYGVSNPSKAESVKEKIKSTCLQRYGTEFAFQSDAVKQKIQSTCIERYGVVNGGASKEAQEKISKTLQTKYGVDSLGKLLQLQEVKDKIRNVSIEKYGTSWPSQSATTKEAYKRTCIEKYGCKNYSTYVAYQMMCSNEYSQPLFTLKELDDTRDYESLKFKCLKCGKEYVAAHIDGFHRRCPDCFPQKMHGTSDEELELLAHMKEVVGEDVVAANDRTLIAPYELDALVESKGIAVEFDGLFWHSDYYGNDSKAAKMHLMKTELCEDKGIQLIHVFENEWLYKKDIVLSRIDNLLGIWKKTVFARKCQIKEVSSQESRSFQDQNHIQGAANASVNLGLFFNDELVSLMTFSKCRFDKKHEWELVRFCSKLGYHVPGAAGKLLKHFERNWKPKSLVSYADMRWSRGKLYEALGFTLDHTSPPNYWYFKNNNSFQLESRIKYQKHKLASILEHFDESKTEFENMKMNNYCKIYDCGNLVYQKLYERSMTE